MTDINCEVLDAAIDTIAVGVIVFCCVALAIVFIREQR